MQGKHRYRAPHNRPIRLLAGAIAVLVAGAPVASPALDAVVAHAEADTPYPSMPTDQLSWKGIPAREVLRRIIGRLAAGEEAGGRFAYVHLRRWPADPAAGAPATALEDIQTWRAADGSGFRSSAIVSAAPPDPTATAIPAVRATSFEQGGLALTLGAPSARAEVLAGQFDHYGTQLRLRLPEMVAIMNMETCLTSQQRVAALQVLADTDAVMFLGRVEDRNGRNGAAFSLIGTDNQGATVRDILIYDEATGDLLSYERQYAEAFTTSGVRPAVVTSYVLYLRCGYTEYQGHMP